MTLRVFKTHIIHLDCLKECGDAEISLLEGSERIKAGRKTLYYFVY
jgi:hypothetical protein